MSLCQVILTPDTPKEYLTPYTSSLALVGTVADPTSVVCYSSFVGSATVPIRNPQPATRNPQPATRNPQPATRNSQLATRNS